MARQARPWYSSEKKAFFAYVNRRKVRLVSGDQNVDNEKLAAKNLKQILKGTRNDTPAGRLRVADVIDRYLTLNKPKYSDRAFAERWRYLQLFAEEHGFRVVNDRDCLPVHVEEWIAAHPEWRSDWTKAQVLQIVMRPFNWAVKKRLIPSNPFRGVEQAKGEPRRPLTDSEFQALLRASFVRGKRQRPRKLYPCDVRRRQRPSSAARFRMVLVFLRFTGCRPGELCNLVWNDIDLAGREIVLRRHKTSKKTKRVRRVPLHPVVLKLLIFLRGMDQPGEHVFLTHRWTPWNRSNLGLRMRRVREAAGLPIDAKLYGLVE
jgi:integrase